MLNSILIATVATLGYHLAQKFISGRANPAAVLIVTYSVALAISLVALWWLPFSDNLIVSLREAGWASVALGLAVVGIELGFLFVYRAGWNVSTAGLVANASVAVILLPLGLLFFRERLSPVNLIGIVVCIVGLILINIQSS